VKKKFNRICALAMAFIMLFFVVSPYITSSKIDAAVSDPNVNYVNNNAYARVHDPVILEDNGTYYMYSTGIIGWGVELRTSTDLVNWTYVSEFATSHDNELKVPDVMNATNNAMTNVWAPEVIKVGSEYWMYYSCSGSGGRNSCMALAKATSPTGPFTYEGIVLQTTNSTESYMNGIDASIEYDQDGNMWMSYGSFFGGIRVVQLNSSTGFLMTSGDEGTLIASRPSSIDNGAVEAPVIRYHDGYYYLFVSYDNLFGPERGGGGSYHVRVGRSTSITGPYVDQDGEAMLVAGETTGYKLTANYKFDGATGWWAVGHCDILETSDGKWIYASHARVNGDQNAPYSYIHQMTWNKEGWPTLSPEPYVGETIGTMTEADAAGKYERLAFHDNKETLANTLTSVEMKLNLDKTATIEGISETGTWSFSGDNTVTVTVGDVTEVYTLMEAWDAENNKATVVLTGNDSNTQLQRWAKRTTQYKESDGAPVAHYVSDGATFYDTVTGTLTGTLAGNATISGDSVTTTYEAGNTGHTNYVQMTNPLNGTEVDEVTISLLGTVAANGQYAQVFTFYTSAGFFSLNADGSIHFNDWSGNYFDDAVDTAISNQTSEHLYSLVISGNTITVYCDETVINTYTNATNVAAVKTFLASADYMSLGTGNDTMGAGGQNWSWPTAGMTVKEFIVLDEAVPADELLDLPGVDEAVKYTVTATATPAAGGSVSGAGTYKEGASVTLTATPNTGYRFTGWTIGGESVGTETTYTISSLAEDVEVVANFAELPKYTVTATANPTAGGSVSGAGEYSEGASATVTATANSGYQFVRWEAANGTQVSTNASYTFEVTADTVLTAVFAEKTFAPIAYYISDGTEFYDTVRDGEIGTLAGNATISGDSVTTTYEAGNTGHTNYVQMTNPLNGTEVDEVTISLLGTVAANGQYAQVFTFYTSAGFFSLNADGSIHFNDWSGNYFDDAVDTAISNQTSEHLYSLVISGNTITVYCDETVINTYTNATNVAAVKTFLASADYMSLGTGNDTMGAGGLNWSWPTAGMTVKEFIVLDEAVPADELLDLPGNAQTTEYTVTATADPTEGGTVSGAGTYKEGASVTLTATPNTGYRFTGWTIGGENVGNATTYTISDLAADTEVVANFEAIPTYTVTATANPAAGGSVSGAGTYSEGASVTLTATASIGYKFTDWTIGGESVGTETTYTISSLAEDVEVVANFAELPKYTVTTTADPAAGGSVSGAGTYTEGFSVTVTASVNEGYRFVGWENASGTVVSTNASYTFNVTEDVALTAAFEVKPEGEYDALAYFVSSGNVFYDTVRPGEVGELEGASTINGDTVTVTNSGDGNTGHTNYVQMTNPLAASTVDEVTVSLLGTVDADGEYATVFAFYTDEGFFSLAADGTIHFNDWDGNYFDDEVDTAISDTASEHMYSLVISGDTITVYCDGEVINTYTDATNVGYVKTFLASADYMSIGTGNDTSGADWSWPSAGVSVKEFIVLDEAVPAEDLVDLAGTYPTPSYAIATDKTEGGKAAGGGTYTAGTSATVIARAFDGYKFTGWTNSDGKVVSKQSTYTFDVIESTTLTANFKPVSAGASDGLLFGYDFNDPDDLFALVAGNTDILETYTVVDWYEQPKVHDILYGPRDEGVLDEACPDHITADRIDMPWGPSAKEGDYYLDFLGVMNNTFDTTHMYGLKAGGTVTLPESTTFTLSYDYYSPYNQLAADFGTITLQFGDANHYLTIKAGARQIYVQNGTTGYNLNLFSIENAPTTSVAVEDVWYHVTLSFKLDEATDTSKLTVYLTPYDSEGNLLTDQQLVSTQDTLTNQEFTVPAFDSEEITMYIGTGINASYTHNSYLDNLYMFSDAMTDDEVQEEIENINRPVVTGNKVIVLDYGLDVTTEVLGSLTATEIFSKELVGIRISSEALPEIGDTLASGFETTATGTYGTASMSGSYISYSLDKMLSNTEVIQFAVKYTYIDLSEQYVYHTLSIVPAKTVYYEDTFVSSNTVNEEGSTQKDSQSDANIVYGYDDAYANTSNVNSNGTVADLESGTTFTFTGTGFDLIGRTDTDGYMIKVTVKDASTNATKKIVYLNTFYEDGALYQLPLVSVTGLAHGDYTVQITLFDKNSTEDGMGWNFYLDGVRIYDPLTENDEMKLYYADGEADATFEEFRNLILGDDPLAFITAYTDGSIGIGAGSTFVEQYDGTNYDEEDTLTNNPSKNVQALEDYLQSGPNNELYLTPGNAVAFYVENVVSSEKLLQFGAKSLNGGSGTVTVATVTGGTTKTDVHPIQTRTEMYYAINTANLSATDKTLVVIANTSTSEYISLTQLKSCGYALAETMLTQEEILISMSGTEYEEIIATLDYIYLGNAEVENTDGFDIEIMGSQIDTAKSGTLGIVAGMPVLDYYNNIAGLTEVGMVLMTADDIANMDAVTESVKADMAESLTVNASGATTVSTPSLQYDYSESSTAAFRVIISGITETETVYFARAYAIVNGETIYGDVYATSLAYVQEQLGVQ